MTEQDIANHYPDHLARLQKITREALARENIDRLVIHSGQPKRKFLDDNQYPFTTNPLFTHWLPLTHHPHCWLILDGVSKPALVYYQPVDFWHKVPDFPTEFWVDEFDIQVLSQPALIEQFLPSEKGGVAYLGECVEVARALGFEHVNPDRVVHYLHYQRSYKSAYEQACMRKANRIAIVGHLASEIAFHEGRSEFGIHLTYLAATHQSDHELPYPNIVTLNENAAILHNTVPEKLHPEEYYSFLIDAGASYNGYAADITRTYAKDANSEFASLIAAVNKVALALVDELSPGTDYTAIQLSAYRKIAAVLTEFNIVTIAADDAVAEGIVSTFFPHGIGHFLGIQVHDVAGLVQDDKGTPRPAPAQHPFLRCTRKIEPNQVFTIEPGLYFIDSLLSKLRAGPQAKHINWNRVAAFRPCGGIRVEDNVIVHRDRNENMTRELGLSD